MRQLSNDFRTLRSTTFLRSFDSIGTKILNEYETVRCPDKHTFYNSTIELIQTLSKEKRSTYKGDVTLWVKNTDRQKSSQYPLPLPFTRSGLYLIRCLLVLVSFPFDPIK